VQFVEFFNVIVGAVKKTIDVPMDFKAKSARDGAWYVFILFVSRSLTNLQSFDILIVFCTSR